MPGIEDIRAAAARITVHRTPVMTSRLLDEQAGAQLFFKCENLQRTGSFRIRGALNAVLLLPNDTPAVVTHSSGNFAQALALAARIRGIAAHIVMPSDAPAAKKRAVEGYGGRVVLCEPTLDARESTAKQVRKETGATFVHPYDHDHVIAGQGTIALELLDQVPDLDTIVVPIGGGGLIGGIALAVHAVAPHIRVIAAEPAGADDAARSKAAGRLIPQLGPRTIADGLRTGLGERTWPIVRDHVHEVVTVDDATILATMRLLWERLKLVVEPSGAVSAAVALGRARGGRAGVVLSGGNADLDTLLALPDPRDR